MTHRRSEKGFTVIELSIVILIIGLLMAPMFQAMSIYMKRKVLTTTEENIKEIQIALQEYIKDTGNNPGQFLPCPAPLDLPRSDPNYAVSVTCDGGIAAGTFLATGRGGESVRTGAVPARTLGLPISHIKDGHGMLITYSVTESQTADAAVPVPYNKFTGAISVRRDSLAGTEMTALPPGGTAPFVLISNGGDGNGSYTADGALMSPCTAGTVDSANCDYGANAVFVSQDGFSMMDMPADPNHYDDKLRFDLNTSDLTISCPNPGEVMESVANGIATCVPGTAGQSCTGVNEVLTGFDAAGNPVCVVSNPVGVDCPGGGVVAGFDVNGNPNCVTAPAGPPGNSGPPGTTATVTATCAGGHVLQGIRAGRPICVAQNVIAPPPPPPPPPREPVCYNVSRGSADASGINKGDGPEKKYAGSFCLPEGGSDGGQGSSGYGGMPLLPKANASCSQGEASSGAGYYKAGFGSRPRARVATASCLQGETLASSSCSAWSGCPLSKSVSGLSVSCRSWNITCARIMRVHVRCCRP